MQHTKLLMNISFLNRICETFFGKPSEAKTKRSVMRKVTWPFFWMHSLIPALPFTENKWRILHMPTHSGQRSLLRSACAACDVCVSLTLQVRRGGGGGGGGEGSLWSSPPFFEYKVDTWTHFALDSHLHHVVVVLQGLKFSVRYRPGVLVVNPVKCKPNYKKDRRVFARVVLCLWIHT